MHQKLLDHAKQSAASAIKTSSKRVIGKTAEATGDFIGNEITNVLAKSHEQRIRKFSKNSEQNNSERVTN